MNTMRNILFSGVVLGLCAILFCLIMFVSCSSNVEWGDNWNDGDGYVHQDFQLKKK